ncbi:hypothetical protein M409DRAFT_68269 [Zasmidium cellare ATCC 36951]|uniref:PPM-type phosphatase domain-containing protein n=1 Tax=Zasmidium cellare ATCC 36951 TaxID=1080233 RepID=A0A6A6C938_ZASCE|nr:uncharacterized protein M409DRAFT_68269 [Zasmidium cellare ATCC 36951]KAF2163654.1 hypothetical protein M409DRAFT_68269 [Zasmidium cellare ATCC 36951]
MWARTLHASRRQLGHSHRTVRFSRRYNAQAQGPHTTYFQQPPPPQQPSRSWRIIRTLLWSSTCFGLGAFATAWAFTTPLEELLREAEEGALEDALLAGTTDKSARQVDPMDVDTATALLELQAAYSVCPAAVSHTAQHGSNLPCEDTWSSGSYVYFSDQKKDWSEWSIFDGHAGPRTSHALCQLLPVTVGTLLENGKCMERSYVPNDSVIISTIKKAFQSVDETLIEQTRKLIRNEMPMPMLNPLAPGMAQQQSFYQMPLAQAVSAGALAFSGSCALLALFDPVRSILRVANVGDSRAVLGRWDAASKKYIAVPMTVDQTGFNQDEVARLAREHPGEDVVDPKTGRVHGLAVSRAFGDARWKWSEEDTRLAHEKFWGPSPRPNGVIKTPPYLTAEPEIMETRIQTGDRPDFLIMASDGLWDNMSSEVAVECVQAWLDKNKPMDFLDAQQQPARTWRDVIKGDGSAEFSTRTPTYSNPAEITGEDDTYYDEEERCRKWKVAPKHFVVEDANCGVHMVKNALGGKRRDLFTGVMSVQPPLSRNVRDDITVHVIFFGQDNKIERK